MRVLAIRRLSSVKWPLYCYCDYCCCCCCFRCPAAGKSPAAIIRSRRSFFMFVSLSPVHRPVCQQSEEPVVHCPSCRNGLESSVPHNRTNKLFTAEIPKKKKTKKKKKNLARGVPVPSRHQQQQQQQQQQYNNNIWPVRRRAESQEGQNTRESDGGSCVITIVEVFSRVQFRNDVIHNCRRALLTELTRRDGADLFIVLVVPPISLYIYLSCPV